MRWGRSGSRSHLIRPTKTTDNFDKYKSLFKSSANVYIRRIIILTQIWKDKTQYQRVRDGTVTWSWKMKMKLVCIGKSQNPPTFKKTQLCHFPVLYFNQTNAWMNREVFKDCFVKHFVLAVGDHLCLKHLPQTASCVTGQSSFPFFLRTSNVLVVVAYLPSNVTWLMQPIFTVEHLL